MHIPGTELNIEMNLLVVSCANQLINVYIAYKYSNNDGENDDGDHEDEGDDESMSL